MKDAFASASMVLAAAVLSVTPGAHAVYNLVQAWQGQSFFDGWDFYGGYDNLTNVGPSIIVRSLNLTETEMQGDAIWVNQSLATANRLAYVDGNGKVIIKVDNTTNVLYNDKRDTVRLAGDVKK